MIGRNDKEMETDFKSKHKSEIEVPSGSSHEQSSVRSLLTEKLRQYQVLNNDDDTYYSPQAPYRLLCPHSWRDYQDRKRFANGETEGDQAQLGLDNDGNGYFLTWNRGRTTVRAPLSPTANLPCIAAKPTYALFSTYCAGFKSFPTVIPNDDDEDADATPTPEALPITDDSDLALSPQPASPRPVHFTAKEPESPPTAIDDPLTPRDQAQFLSWHIKFGHAPFKIIRWAARLRILPRKLAHCDNVVCPACLYGKQKRRPWRLKGGGHTPDQESDAPRRMRLCRPAYLRRARACWPNHGATHQGPLQCGNNIRRSLLRPRLRPYPREHLRPRHHQSKASLRTIRTCSRCHCPALSCRQWHICFERLQGRSGAVRTTLDLLRRRSTSPKWRRQEKDTRLDQLGTRKLGLCRSPQQIS